MSIQKKSRAGEIGVIDIFAGPGGLGEGFSSFQANEASNFQPFKIAVSAEMEALAHATLRLRAFVRLLRAKEGPGSNSYDGYLSRFVTGDALSPEQFFSSGKFSDLWNEADREAMQLTMGNPAHNEILFSRIREVQHKYERLILIGGPPCQAYSLVGRARQKNVKNFLSKGDHRHFLYKQYLGILATFSPEVFIMENVKGILTSKVGKEHMFPAIQRDLSNPSLALGVPSSREGAASRYVLLPIHVDESGFRTAEKVAKDPRGFIIRCEDHGVPQARHRVIIMGVREDCVSSRVETVPGLKVPAVRVTAERALVGLPALRSGISRERDDSHEWCRSIEKERKHVITSLPRGNSKIKEELKLMEPAYWLERTATEYVTHDATASSIKTNYVLNHDTRGHMRGDLGRYMFCAAFATANGSSPGSANFPDGLAPEHANWGTGDFGDRFRCQIKDKPSSTVTSHLSKDGNAFIHWDINQCRSITVREAARFQTFPDDYLFLGTRTQQFIQVGNAVPPEIARQIAKVVWDILGA